MCEKRLTRRHIVLIDDVGVASTTPSLQNTNSISRLRAAIRTGLFVDAQGHFIEQDVEYYQAVDRGSTLATKFGVDTTEPHEQQVRNIVLEICENVKDSADEIFMLGSGHGAYTVRAVAGILHHMGIPQPEHKEAFSAIYNATLNLIKTRRVDDGRNLKNVSRTMRAGSCDPANIQFVGLLDALQCPADAEAYDTRLLPTVRHFRHAMAFNENQASKTLDLPQCPDRKDLVGRSFVQAWFLGSHADIVGGTQHDGLSLYPLQWMMIEAMLAGLALSFETTVSDCPHHENPLTLAIPQHTGHAPNLSGDGEDNAWHIRYRNGIDVRMFDLQSVHLATQRSEDLSHSIHLGTPSFLNGTPRRIFSKNKRGLSGYEVEHSFGTIIHPSVFCILHRNQSFLERRQFRAQREDLATFEADCLQNDPESMPPWHQDSELLASGVKAFRILVCGKTGVGKSTLINRIFGVEATEESNSYAQGRHDINTAFESPNHPGLLIHDSRGWQAGSDQELELIEKFLRHRAFQKDPAEALHVIWFCVDADVSRIEEADRRTFETIARFSNNVPVFVVGTKKDKLIAYRQMALLEMYMQKSNNYHESKRLAQDEASKLAEGQFANLRAELGQIKWYKADGYVCLSQDDSSAIRTLLTKTLDMIADERVRLFCVAAQIVDVEKKIDSAITECMRLGTHAIRTAMVPLPLTGMASTPTISRIICEHILFCFGFPKAVPAEVDEVMTRIVLGNLKKYLALSLAQFVVVAAASSGLALATVGAGAVAWLAIPFLNAPPTARMVLKCSAEMILILERSFRYGGRYVTVKQIEDAAKQYVTMNTVAFDGRSKKFQAYVRDEIDRLVPLKQVVVGFRFNRLRTSLEHIIYKNRFDTPPEYEEDDPFAAKLAELDRMPSTLAELPGDTERTMEVMGDTTMPFELDGKSVTVVGVLAGSEVLSSQSSQVTDGLLATSSGTPCPPYSVNDSEDLTAHSEEVGVVRTVSSGTPSIKSKSSKSGSSLLSRMSKSMRKAPLEKEK